VQAILQRRSDLTPKIVINSVLKIWRIAAVATCVLLVTGLKINAQSTYLQHFSTKNGLPSNNCYYTLQDSKGYIWVSTDAGVSRFDGKVFENFSIDDGLPDNQILQLKEDRHGRIWFLALNGELSYFYNGKIYNETNNNQLRLLKLDAVIVSFFEDSKGRVWLGTNKNVLVMWDGKSIVKYVSANVNRQFINTFVHEDAAGKIWAFSSQCIHRFDHKTFVTIQHSSLPLSYKVGLNLPDRTMAYLDHKGLNIRAGHNQYQLLKIDPKILDNNPGYFYLGTKNDLWLSNATGIYHINTTGQTMRYLENISSSQVIKDTKDNMWFTTTSGIYMLPNKEERLYLVNKANGLSTDIVKSITKDQQDRLWLGLTDGQINTLNLDNFKVGKIQLADQQKFNYIKQLVYDQNNNTLYFSSDYGLGKINNADKSSDHIDYLRESRNSMFVVKSFSIDSGKSMALALSSGVFIVPDRIRDFKFDYQQFNPYAKLFNNRSYRTFYDKEQHLWFSNVNGLSEFFNTELHNYYSSSPLLTKRINDIQELNDGTIVLATDGYGIVFLKNKKIIKVITARNGLADNICKKLFVKDNHLWIITNNGINRIDMNQSKFHVESFEYTNPMLADDVSSLYIDHQYAYFATNSGLVYFEYADKPGANIAPKVFISYIVNNKVRLSLNQKNHILAPSSNNISFTYSAIDFQNRSITYRYRLKNDAAWTETKNRRLEFSSLEPGTSSFEIAARSNNSNWSKPAKVNFTLKKHIWQTTWFLAVFFSLAAFGFYKWAVLVTTRQRNKEKEKLLLKNKILMLEQRALQAMMNPHFVFNVMNSIQHYINTKDTTSANKILTGFAKLIRKNLDICTRSYITLAEEIDYLELYLSLEKKRFGQKLHYNIRINDKIDMEETMVPSMILQPYIENAIWHGIMPREEGGKIDIRIDLYGEQYLLIKIIDDGVGIDNSLKDKHHPHQSKGMSLTKERINLLNQIGAYPIKIEIRQNGISGTYVSISVPIN
jgi:sensor histidine kinase YesM